MRIGRGRARLHIMPSTAPFLVTIVVRAAPVVGFENQATQESKDNGLQEVLRDRQAGMNFENQSHVAVRVRAREGAYGHFCKCANKVRETSTEPTLLCRLSALSARIIVRTA